MLLFVNESMYPLNPLATLAVPDDRKCIMYTDQHVCWSSRMCQHVQLARVLVITHVSACPTRTCAGHHACQLARVLVIKHVSACPTRTCAGHHACVSMSNSHVCWSSRMCQHVQLARVQFITHIQLARVQFISHVCSSSRMANSHVCSHHAWLTHTCAVITHG